MINYISQSGPSTNWLHWFLAATKPWYFKPPEKKSKEPECKSARDKAKWVEMLLHFSIKRQRISWPATKFYDETSPCCSRSFYKYPYCYCREEFDTKTKRSLDPMLTMSKYIETTRKVHKHREQDDGHRVSVVFSFVALCRPTCSKSFWESFSLQEVEECYQNNSLLSGGMQQLGDDSTFEILPQQLLSNNTRFR